METSTNIAFKEWAVVCAALQTGRQIIVVRKGGIDEGSDGFRVRHREFWLLPTRFHADPAALAAGSEALWPLAAATQPPAGKIRLDLYAHVSAVFELCEEAQLAALAGEQVLSLETLRQRFFYRQPRLFVLALRVLRLPVPLTIDDTPYIAGCKSWVELPAAMSAAGAQPVLDDAEFAIQLSKLQSL